MSTMVVRMNCRPGFREEVIRHLREDVIVWAREQAGFVAGSWHVSDDGRWSIGFVEFDSPVAAERAAVAPRSFHDPDAPFRIAGVEIYERVADAAAAAGS